MELSLTVTYRPEACILDGLGVTGPYLCNDRDIVSPFLLDRYRGRQAGHAYRRKREYSVTWAPVTNIRNTYQHLRQLSVSSS